MFESPCVSSVIYVVCMYAFSHSDFKFPFDLFENSNLLQVYLIYLIRVCWKASLLIFQNKPTLCDKIVKLFLWK